MKFLTESPELSIGAKVRLVAPSPLVTLSADTGTIVRADEWDGYYIVHLDSPAAYRDGDVVEALWEIREASDNLEVVPQQESES